MPDRFRPDIDADSLTGVLRDWYHVPALVAVVVYMIAVRSLAVGNFLRDGAVYFSGNDAWYHYRNVQYTVQNWPATMPFDPYTQFPYGTHVGQFGTLYDQLVATVALIVGLGSPSDQTIGVVLLFSPVVLGALVAVAAYLIATRLAGRPEGVLAAVFLALLPGEFLRRTTVGFADHHAAEVLFQGLAVAAIIVALQVAREEPPAYELIAQREWGALLQPARWAGIAGVALALYMWVWPPAILLVGIAGAFVLLWLPNEVRAGGTPEPAAFVFAVATAVAGLLLAVNLDTLGFDVTSLSLLHVVGTLGVGAAALTLAAVARVWERRGFAPRTYPVAAAGAVVLGFVGLAVVMPRAFDIIVSNVQSTLIPFSSSGSTRTIAEARPLASAARPSAGYELTHVLLRQYGTLFHLATISLVGMAVLGERRRPGRWFAGVWAVFIALAAFTQIRFNYYLVLPVAVFAAIGIGGLCRRVGIDDVPVSIDDVEAHHVFVVGGILLLVVPVLLVPVPLANTGGSQVVAEPTYQRVADDSPDGFVQWEGSLEWLAENTPREGEAGGADNGFGPYDRYERPADDNFDYPEGSYGVMAWWDYGHWITVEGERAPYANPFQQGSTVAANYLLAPSEEQAHTAVSELDEEGGDLGYVMVDWQMIHTGAKMSAPVVFYDDADLQQNDLAVPVTAETEGGHVYAFDIKTQRYHESMAVRLYRYHGSAQPAQPVVVDWDTEEVQTANGPTRAFVVPDDRPAVQTFDNMSAAEQYVQQDGTARIGGIGGYPAEHVDALEHYRLVAQSQSSAAQSPTFQQSLLRTAEFASVDTDGLYINQPAWVKTFERVPGATVEGSGPPNSTVIASVEMQSATGATFTYTQHAETGPDGGFEMTLPYSTAGYDRWGPANGHTDVSVRATGPYTFTTDDGSHGATAHVPEAKVIGEDDDPVTVAVEPTNETAG